MSSRHCVLRQKNPNKSCFYVFFASRVDFQRAGRTHTKPHSPQNHTQPSVRTTLQTDRFRDSWGCLALANSGPGSSSSWRTRMASTTNREPHALPAGYTAGTDLVQPTPRRNRKAAFAISGTSNMRGGCGEKAENDWSVTIELYCYSSQHTNHTWEWTAWWFSEHLWGIQIVIFRGIYRENNVFYDFPKIFDVIL